MPLAPIYPRATTNRFGVVMVGSGLTIDADGSLKATTGGGGDALTSNPLSQFAATTSAQLRGVLTDETGTGAAVFASSPTLITPTFTGEAAGSVSGSAATSDDTMKIYSLMLMGA